MLRSFPRTAPPRACALGRARLAPHARVLARAATTEAYKNENLVELYSTPKSPFIPAPLPPESDVLPGDDISSSMLKRRASAFDSINEDVALLTVCLESGDIPRAYAIFNEVINSKRARNSRRRTDPIYKILTPAFHAEFLTALFRAPYAPEVIRANAWAYFNSLFYYEWRNSRGELCAVDENVFAVLIKGLTILARRPDTGLSGPVSSLDPAADSVPAPPPLSHVLVALSETPIQLYDIFRAPLFATDRASALGACPAAEAIEALRDDVVDTGGAAVQEYLVVLDQIATRLAEPDAVSEEQRKIADFSQSVADVLATSAVPASPATDAVPGDALFIRPTYTNAPDGEGPVMSASLDLLRKNLEVLQKTSPNITDQEIRIFTQTERQKILEEVSYDAAHTLHGIEADQLKAIGRDRDGVFKSNKLQGLMGEWVSVLEARFERDAKPAEVKTTKARKAAKAVPVEDVGGSEGGLDAASAEAAGEAKDTEADGAETKDAEADGAEAKGAEAATAPTPDEILFEEREKSSPWRLQPDLEPFLNVLSPQKLALLTVVELLRMCGSGRIVDGVKTARALLHIGRSVENEYRIEKLKSDRTLKQFQRDVERTMAAYDISGSVNNMPRSVIDIMWRRELAKRESQEDAQRWTQDWSQSIRVRLGAVLVAAAVDELKIERTAYDRYTDKTVTEWHPAFAQTYQYVRGTKVGILKVNEVIAQTMDLDSLKVALHPRFMPMLVRPKPWVAYNNGAYLTHSGNMMRTKDSPEQLAYLRAASEAGSLELIFEGLDALGSVAWKINKDVFNVVREVWNKGEQFCDIPPADSLLSPIKTEKPEKFENPRQRETYRQNVRNEVMAKRSQHSVRSDTNYKLETAKAYLDETFYFPHNVDFRGRAYPIPATLSHIGNDLCRGLLTFGERKPLGERGLLWLKVHLANLTGNDKISLEDRARYAEEHIEDVFDSADHPLDGRRWWATADDPWQCLATCIELAKALRSEDPTKFESSLPVHQDGTCNGLQHYAALGGDMAGAQQVNLQIVGDKPSDVYTGVADLVNEIIDADAASGHALAKLLQGKITRKVVKQTVMTTVYGVTFVGAKKQIERQLRDRGDIPTENLYHCSTYLGHVVMGCIGDLFKGATAIQNWLQQCARLVSRTVPSYRAIFTAGRLGDRPTISPSRVATEMMTSVAWSTPLGLPVVQPYRKERRKQVSTALQTVFISDPSLPCQSDSRAQTTAFPPNFIHSLDATHMLLTALACRKTMSFASVHDSYWTHACNVDEMSVHLRDAFIELHSQDILGHLLQDLKERYSDYWLAVESIPEDFEGPVYNALGEEMPFEKTEDFRKPSVALVTKDGTPRNRTEVEEEQMKFWAAQTKRSKLNCFVRVTDILPPVPAKGDFDLRKIRESLYFFS